ncbi:nitroreductase/quinone reductase family protein [Mycolicibacterium sp. Y3]
MTANQRLFGFITTSFGTRVEHAAVRWLGYSPMTHLYARTNGVAYNHPLLLTTTGRKSGRKFSVVLPWFGFNGNIVIVGSRGGTSRDPDWALNLRSNHLAEAIIRCRSHIVSARELQGPERAECWDQLITRVPDYATYQKRASRHRTIPVFVLTMMGGNSGVKP